MKKSLKTGKKHILITFEFILNTFVHIFCIKIFLEDFRTFFIYQKFDVKMIITILIGYICRYFFIPSFQKRMYNTLETTFSKEKIRNGVLGKFKICYFSFNV